MAHILGSQFVWLARLNSDLSSGDLIWPEWSIEDCEVSLEKIKQNRADFLNKNTEYSLIEKISYQNTQGQTFATPIRDIREH